MGSSDQGVDKGRWKVIPRTLCFVTNNNDVLLLKRAPHRRVFPGRYNGVGGHLERDEDPRSGAIREIREETGLVVSQVQLRGITHIDPGNDPGILLFIFTAISESRTFVPCDEGTLEWVSLRRVDELPLVEDLAFVLPRLFGNEKTDLPFFAHVRYNDVDQMLMTFAENAGSF